MFGRRKNIIKQASKRLAPDGKQFKAIFEDFFFNSASEQKHQQKNNNFQTKKPKEKRKESYYRDKLAKSLNGQTEVKISFGRIDILTSSQIIEVKHIKKWNAALGQIIIYGSHYPHHQKRIHLFGEENSLEKIIFIKKQCQEQNIIVTFER